MVWNVFKKNQVRCNKCREVILATSATEWVECGCGSVAVMGFGLIKKVRGTDYTDLSETDWDEAQIPKGS